MNNGFKFEIGDEVVLAYNTIPKYSCKKAVLVDKSLIGGWSINIEGAGDYCFHATEDQFVPSIIYNSPLYKALS